MELYQAQLEKALWWKRFKEELQMERVLQMLSNGEGLEWSVSCGRAGFSLKLSDEREFQLLQIAFEGPLHVWPLFSDFHRGVKSSD